MQPQTAFVRLNRFIRDSSSSSPSADINPSGRRPRSVSSGIQKGLPIARSERSTVRIFSVFTRGSGASQVFICPLVHTRPVTLTLMDNAPLHLDPPSWLRDKRHLPRVEDWQPTEPAQPWSIPPAPVTRRPRDRSSSNSYAPGEERGRKGWNPPRGPLDELTLGNRLYTWHGKPEGRHPKIMADHYDYLGDKDVPEDWLEEQGSPVENSRKEDNSIQQQDNPEEPIAHSPYLPGPVEPPVNQSISRQSSVTTIRPTNRTLRHRNGLNKDFQPKSRTSLFLPDIEEELDALRSWQRRGWKKNGWEWEFVFEGKEKEQQAISISAQLSQPISSYDTMNDGTTHSISSDSEPDTSPERTKSTPPSSEEALQFSPSPSPSHNCSVLPSIPRTLVGLPIPPSESPLEVDASQIPENRRGRRQRRLQTDEPQPLRHMSPVASKPQLVSDQSSWFFGQEEVIRTQEHISVDTTTFNDYQETIPRLNLEAASPDNRFKRDALSSLRDALSAEASARAGRITSPALSVKSLPPHHKKKGWKRSLLNFVDISARLGAAYVDNVSSYSFAASESYSALDSQTMSFMSSSSPSSSISNSPFSSPTTRTVTLSSPASQSHRLSIGTNLSPVGYRTSWEQVCSAFPGAFYTSSVPYDANGTIKLEEEGEMLVPVENWVAPRSPKSNKPPLPPRSPKRRRSSSPNRGVSPRRKSFDEPNSEPETAALSLTIPPSNSATPPLLFPPTASPQSPGTALVSSPSPQKPLPCPWDQVPGRPMPRDPSMTPITTLRPIANPLYLRVNGLINTMFERQLPWQGYGNGYAQSGDKVWGRKVWWPPRDGSEMIPATYGDGTIVLKSARPEPSKLRFERYEWEWMWSIWREEEMKRIELERKRKNLLELREFLGDNELEEDEDEAVYLPLSSQLPTTSTSRSRKRSSSKTGLLSMMLVQGGHG